MPPRQSVGECTIDELTTSRPFHFVENRLLVEGETEAEYSGGHAGQEEDEESENQGLAGFGSTDYHPEPPAPRRATTRRIVSEVARPLWGRGPTACRRYASPPGAEKRISTSTSR